MPWTDQPQRIGAYFGGYIDAKPTEYHGVEMRSKLEADFALHLDWMGVGWVYEPAIYGEVGSGYLPDFRIDQPEGPTFVELKPTLAQAEAAKARMTVIWQSHPDAVLLVVSAQESRFFAAVKGKPWTTWVERWEHS